MPVRIVVASTNPVKVESVCIGFMTWLGENEIVVTGVDVPSGISHQPMTDNETYQGAENRAYAAQQLEPDADYWVGIEGGAETRTYGMAAFAWMVVLSRSQKGVARSASFPLPDAVADLVLQGVELGSADDMVFGRENSKRANGAVGLLTNDRVTRTHLYSHAMVLALIPFMNPELYPHR